MRQELAILGNALASLITNLSLYCYFGSVQGKAKGGVQ